MRPIEAWTTFAAAALTKEASAYSRNGDDDNADYRAEAAARLADAMMLEWDKRNLELLGKMFMPNMEEECTCDREPGALCPRHHAGYGR